MLRFIAGNSNGGASRREILRVGGLGLLTGVADLASARVCEAGRGSNRFGRARSIIFVTLYGGPPQTETFDMKPTGPEEARPFRPIQTRRTDLQICEFLPRLAQISPSYTIVRSVSHSDTAHAPALYTFCTGWPHPQPNVNSPARPDDAPHYGALVGRARPGWPPVPSCVVVGGRILPQFGGIGQTGGYLGSGGDPFFVDEGSTRGVENLRLVTPAAEVPAVRLDGRQRLIDSLSATSRPIEQTSRGREFSSLQSRAFELLNTRSFAEAFNVEAEPAETRATYGQHPLGRNLLLARRLVEAHVPVIQVSDLPPGGEHHWDLHYADIFDRLKNPLLPRLDEAVSALLTDLQERGLLEQTLVVVGGEFGRTPWIDKLEKGRQHWPNCYSLLIAGGGLRPGCTFGASDRSAAYPTEDPVGPWDIGATILHLAGIDPAGEVYDRQGRPRPICRGQVIRQLL